MREVTCITGYARDRRPISAIFRTPAGCLLLAGVVRTNDDESSTQRHALRRLRMADSARQIVPQVRVFQGLRRAGRLRAVMETGVRAVSGRDILSPHGEESRSDVPNTPSPGWPSVQVWPNTRIVSTRHLIRALGSV